MHSVGLQVMDKTEIHAVPNTLMIVGLASLGINYFAGRICQVRGNLCLALDSKSRAGEDTGLI